MKIIKTASGNQIKMSKAEWEDIGKTAGWEDEPQAEAELPPVTDEEINQLSYFMETVSNNMEALKRILDLISRDPSYKEEYEMAISMVAKIGNASRELYTPPENYTRLQQGN